MEILQDRLQRTYDTFIKMSNIAFNNNVPAIAEYATGKAEAYEHSASLIFMMAVSLGVTIESDTTDLHKFISQERKDSCRADAETDSVKEESFD